MPLQLAELGFEEHSADYPDLVEIYHPASHTAIIMSRVDLAGFSSPKDFLGEYIQSVVADAYDMGKLKGQNE